MYIRLFNIIKNFFKFILFKISRIINFTYVIISRIKFYIIPSELYSTPLLEKLKKEAVWLIIDPWETQPEPYNNEYVNNINNYYCKKINEYMHDVQHKFVVLDENDTVHKIFKGYPRIEHQFANDKIKDNFDTIVYVGFHHGRCTIDRPVSGARNMSKKYKLYFKENLLCLLPGDSWIEMDKKVKKFGEII